MQLRHQLMTTTLKSQFMYYQHSSIHDVTPDTIELLKQADTHFANYDSIKAAELYHKAYAKNPTSACLSCMVGTMFIIHGDIAEGIKHLRLSIQQNGACMGAHYNLGTTLLGRGVFESAREHLQKARELDPSNPAILNNLGLVHLHLNQGSKACEYFEKSLHVQDNDCAAHNLGCIAYDQNNMTQALHWFEKAYQSNQQNFVTLNNMACALFLNGEAHKAIETLYKTIALNPRYRMPYYNLGFMVYSDNHVHQSASATT